VSEKTRAAEQRRRKEECMGRRKSARAVINDGRLNMRDVTRIMRVDKPQDGWVKMIGIRETAGVRGARASSQFRG
jgi:hypothetical protein